MSEASSNLLQTTSPVRWREEYLSHLDRRLGTTIAYLREAPPDEHRRHARSYLTLLDESHRYTELTGRALELIAVLHPLPVRWELTHAWEPELRFALEHTPGENLARRAEYGCALGDLLVFSGRFGEAIDICRPLLAAVGVPDALAARAGRIVFLCLSYTGRGGEAEGVVVQNRERFMVGRPAADVSPDRMAAWLAFSPSWLDVLRNQGRIDESIRLADDMIAMDRRLGSPDPIRTADLLTQRSTLLWQGTRYGEAIEDLNASICLYRKSGDELNAESRQNNLGLVYWSMGELKLAETNLKAARELYRRIGLDQMYIHTSGNLGLVHLFRGDMEQAARVFQGQMDLAERRNFVSEYNRGRWNLAITRYYQGDACDAMEVYRSTLDYYETRGGRETYFSHWIWVAFCMDRQGEHEQAVALLHDVIDKAVEYQYPNLEQVALRGLASLLPRAEQETPLRRSLEMATRAGSRFEVAATWLALSGTFDDAQRRQRAWQTGAGLLREIGGEAWLEGHASDDPPLLPLTI